MILSTGFEVEKDPETKVWLRQFSEGSSRFFADVSKLKHGARLPCVKAGTKVKLDGKQLLSYWYCFSCKDFSTLNKFSEPIVQDCLETSRGTSGITWSANYQFILGN